MFTKYWQDNLQETDDADGQGVNGKMILKCISKKVGKA